MIFFSFGGQVGIVKSLLRLYKDLKRHFQHFTMSLDSLIAESCMQCIWSTDRFFGGIFFWEVCLPSNAQSHLLWTAVSFLSVCLSGIKRTVFCCICNPEGNFHSCYCMKSVWVFLGGREGGKGVKQNSWLIYSVSLLIVVNKCNHSCSWEQNLWKSPLFLRILRSSFVHTFWDGIQNQCKYVRSAWSCCFLIIISKVEKKIISICLQWKKVAVSGQAIRTLLWYFLFPKHKQTQTVKGARPTRAILCNYHPRDLDLISHLDGM